MKNFRLFSTPAFLILALLATDIAFAGGAGQPRRGGPRGSALNNQPRSQNNQGFQVNSGEVLTEKTKQDLVTMLEEEKLARDVYLALGKTSKQQIFSKISQAESRHMNAVANLLQSNGMNVSIPTGEPGKFTNPQFTNLYKTLVAAGSNSVLEAYKVGAKIEEMDIADLRKLKSGISNERALFVLNNLERGSRNHLRAFAAGIKQLNGTYQAEYLTQKEFESIAASSMEKGGRGGGAKGGGQQGRGRRRQGR